MMHLNLDMMLAQSFIHSSNRHAEALDGHRISLDALAESNTRIAEIMYEHVETMMRFEQAAIKLTVAMAAYTRAVKAERGE